VEEKNRFLRRCGGENRLVGGEKNVMQGQKRNIHPYLESRIGDFGAEKKIILPSLRAIKR